MSSTAEIYEDMEEWRKSSDLPDENPGEVICTNLQEIYPTMNQLILFLGLNPGKAHGYTIEQNISDHKNGLTEDRCWYGWGTHNIPKGIKAIMASLYPSKDIEEIKKSILYSNTSFFRTRHQDKIKKKDFDISYPLVKKLINKNKKPFFVFGTMAYKNISKRMRMSVVSSHSVGWGKWKVKLYKNNKTNEKMIGLPHLSYDWATRKEVPDEVWTEIRKFIET